MSLTPRFSVASDEHCISEQTYESRYERDQRVSDAHREPAGVEGEVVYAQCQGEQKFNKSAAATGDTARYIDSRLMSQ